MIDSPVPVALTFRRIDSAPQLFPCEFAKTIVAEMWSDSGGNVQGEANLFDDSNTMVACVSRTAGFSEWYSELPGYSLEEINGFPVLN